MKRYKVHARSPRYFDSLEDARAFANEYWRKTGNIVAVTEIKTPARPKSDARFYIGAR